MLSDPEKIIDEITSRLKKGRDISYWQNDPSFAPIANLLSKLSLLPKARIPSADFTRVKNQILDRISIPAEEAKPGIFAAIPGILKLATGIIGMLLIVISLGIGTAVAALNSVPGQPLYGLKKTVENVELAFARSPETRANLQIQFANNRLNELTAVIEKSQSGEISSVDAQKIVSQTVSELQASTTAALHASNSTTDSKQASALNKIVNLSNKQTAVLTPLLSAANIQTDGETKIAIEQALETSKVSKEQAIKNMENAGLVVENQPISLDAPAINQVNANGQITSLAADSISIGTAKFLVTKDTKYDNIKLEDLKVGTTVKITGENREGKTYAITISVENSPTSQPNSDAEENPANPETQEAN